MDRKFAIEEIQCHKFLPILIPEYDQSNTHYHQHACSLLYLFFLITFFLTNKYLEINSIFDKKEVGVAPRRCSFALKWKAV